MGLALYHATSYFRPGSGLQAKLREMLATARGSKDKLQKEFAQLNDKIAKIQSDLEEQIHQNANLLAENGQKQISIKGKDEEISAAKAETARISKVQAQTAKKLKCLEEARDQSEQQRDILKAGVYQIFSNTIYQNPCNSDFILAVQMSLH